jgi:hypothetical protein
MWRRLRASYGSVAVMWLNTCLLFLVLNVAIALVHRHTAPQPLRPIRSVVARALPDLDGRTIDALIAETERPIAFEPYTDSTDPPVRGTFVNVDAAGFRHSRDQGPWPPDPARHNVFLFGGSTTFGYGVSDADTIASYLQPMLSATGERPTSVYNFGHSGYYSTQERILFERLVIAGHRPDTAIFIDGLNDFEAFDDLPVTAERLAYAYERLEEPPLRTALWLLPVTTTVAHLGRRLGLVVPKATPGQDGDDASRIRVVLDRYRRSKATIAAVGAAHGVRTAFVWHPIPTYDFPPGGDGLRGSTTALAAQGYRQMAAAVAAGEFDADLVWCAGVAADGTAAFYVDFVHYAPVLSERVARCIADALGRHDPRDAAR